MSDRRDSPDHGWVLPLLLLIAVAVFYANVALEYAIPRVVPGLLERATVTESELARRFRALVFALAVILPPLILYSISAVMWGFARLAGARPGLGAVFSMTARASLFLSAGLLVKTALVHFTKTPDPPVNLGFWFPPRTPVRAAMLAVTNPFVVGAAFVCVRSLRDYGLSWERAALTGLLPWIFGLVIFAQSRVSGGVLPAPPAPTEGWATFPGEALTLRCPPHLTPGAKPLAHSLDAFAKHLAEKMQVPPRPITIDLFPDHAALEAATGEALPVLISGSIRGKNLLYLEAPGRSPALPRDTALQDAARYVALMQLAPLAGDAPRWFVEGLAHGESTPYSETLEREYLRALRKTPPSLALLENPHTYRTPEGPLFARGLLDFLALRYGGRDVINGIFRDAKEGKPFRDALYERTRLTATALETEWHAGFEEAFSADSASGPAGSSDRMTDPIPKFVVPGGALGDPSGAGASPQDTASNPPIPASR